MNKFENNVWLWNHLHGFKSMTSFCNPFALPWAVEYEIELNGMINIKAITCKPIYGNQSIAPTNLPPNMWVGCHKGDFIHNLGHMKGSPNSQALIPRYGPTLQFSFRPNLATCKAMRLDFRSQCFWRERLVNRFYLSWINDRDVHYVTYESNLAHVESLRLWKPRPKFFKPAWRFGAKILPPRMPHWMIPCSNSTLV